MRGLRADAPIAPRAKRGDASVFTAQLFTNVWLWGATALCMLLQLASVTVPWLREVLGTVPLSPVDWAVIWTGSLVPVVVVELG